jgi:hypothetical protein
LVQELERIKQKAKYDEQNDKFETDKLERNKLIELMKIEAETDVMEAEVVELPLADQITAQIKAAAGDAKKLATIKAAISMQAATLSPAVAGALSDRVDAELKKLEVAA